MWGTRKTSALLPGSKVAEVWKRATEGAVPQGKSSFHLRRNREYIDNRRDDIDDFAGWGPWIPETSMEGFWKLRRVRWDQRRGWAILTNITMGGEKRPSRARFSLLINFSRSIGHDMVIKNIKRKHWKGQRIRLRPLGAASSNTPLFFLLRYLPIMLEKRYQ